MAWVYNPDDEQDEHDFNGHKFVLAPNAATEIVSPWPAHKSDVIADHLVSRLGMWGLSKVSGPVTGGKASNPDDQAIVDKAEITYMDATRRWAEGRIVDDHKANLPLINAGLKPKPPDAETERAHAWLKAHGF